MEMKEDLVCALIPEPMDACPLVYRLRMCLHGWIGFLPLLERCPSRPPDELELENGQASRKLASDCVLNVTIEGSSALGTGSEMPYDSGV